MKTSIPIRLIMGTICFLYLVLPIPFVHSIREVLGLPVISLWNFSLAVIYSSITFFMVLLFPKEIVIQPQKLDMGKTFSRIVLLITICVSFIIFGVEIINTDAPGFIYFDKILSDQIYEAISSEHSLRLKYNLLLAFFLLANVRSGFGVFGVLFFIPPVLFEVIFSKHNYATHLLMFLFVVFWNRDIQRYKLLTSFCLVVIVLLGIRFTFYSSFQDNILRTISAMLGEFTISWQSIPAALTYDGQDKISSGWYSDALNRASGLDIGLAGNPVAEIVFYFGDAAMLVLIIAVITFAVIFRLSQRSFVSSLALLLTTFYIRDCFRTGWSLGFSVYFKALLFYVIAIYSIRILKTGALSLRPISLQRRCAS
jgi:hypothetical protein